MISEISMFFDEAMLEANSTHLQTLADFLYRWVMRGGYLGQDTWEVILPVYRAYPRKFKGPDVRFRSYGSAYSIHSIHYTYIH